MVVRPKLVFFADSHPISSPPDDAREAGLQHRGAAGDDHACSELESTSTLEGSQCVSNDLETCFQHDSAVSFQEPLSQDYFNSLPLSEDQGSRCLDGSGKDGNLSSNDFRSGVTAESSYPAGFHDSLPPSIRFSVHDGSFSKQLKIADATATQDSAQTNVTASESTLGPARDPLTGVMSICGMRSEMEDAVTVAHRFILLSYKKHKHYPPLCLPDGNGTNMDLPLHFFGVYDGHGGSQVSNICKEKLHLILAEEIQTNADVDPSILMNPQNSWEQCWEKAMKSAFLTIDAHIEGYTWRNCASTESKCARQRVSEALAPETVGSTAVVAVIGPSQIIVASCGDSRAVLSRGGQAIGMSTDHKPNREDELERIEAAGGKVFCWNGYRVFGVLAMSRAIGDRYLKPYIIAEPEVKCIPRSDDDDCLILASDGLWDVLKNEEVCDVACRCLAGRVNGTEVTRSSSYTVGSNGNKAEAAAALLTKMALARGSHDNISVVVVDLKERARS